MGRKPGEEGAVGSILPQRLKRERGLTPDQIWNLDSGGIPFLAAWYMEVSCFSGLVWTCCHEREALQAWNEGTP